MAGPSPNHKKEIKKEKVKKKEEKEEERTKTQRELMLKYAGGDTQFHNPGP